MVVGDRVRKVGRGFIFTGRLAAIFFDSKGAPSVVVEDDRGLMLILRADQIEPVRQRPKMELDWTGL